VVRQDGNTFVLAFGHTAARLEDAWLERDFGRRVALNSIPSNKLIEIHLEQVFAKWHVSRERAPRATSVEEFGVEFDRYLVASVDGIPKDKSLGATVRGSTSLRAAVVELINAADAAREKRANDLERSLERGSSLVS
jgi:uncharacterized protein (TIGR04141 family)